MEGKATIEFNYKFGPITKELATKAMQVNGHNMDDVHDMAIQAAEEYVDQVNKINDLLGNEQFMSDIAIRAAELYKLSIQQAKLLLQGATIEAKVVPEGTYVTFD